MRKKVLIIITIVALLLVSVGCSKKSIDGLNNKDDITDNEVVEKGNTEDVDDQTELEEKQNEEYKDYLDEIASQERVKNISNDKVEYKDYIYTLAGDGSDTIRKYLFKTHKETGEEVNVFSKMDIRLTPSNTSFINPINIIGDTLYISDDYGKIYKVNLDTWEVQELELTERKSGNEIILAGVVASPKYIYYQPETWNIMGDGHHRYMRMNHIGNNVETVVRDVSSLLQVKGNKLYFISSGYDDYEKLQSMVEDDITINKSELREVDPYCEVPETVRWRFDKLVEGEMLNVEDLRLDYKKHLLYELDLETDEVKVIGQDVMLCSYIQVGEEFYCHYSPDNMRVVDIDGRTYGVDATFSTIYKLNKETKLFEEVDDFKGYIVDDWVYHIDEDAAYVTAYEAGRSEKNFAVFRLSSQGIENILLFNPGVEISDIMVSSDGRVYYKLFIPNELVTWQWWFMNDEGKLEQYSK